MFPVPPHSHVIPQKPTTPNQQRVTTIFVLECIHSTLSFVLKIIPRTTRCVQFTINLWFTALCIYLHSPDMDSRIQRMREGSRLYSCFLVKSSQISHERPLLTKQHLTLISQSRFIKYGKCVILVV